MLADYEILGEGGSGSYISLTDGATFSVDANTVIAFRAWIYPVSEDVTWSFTIGAVPAPGALALLGLAGIAVRRNRS